MTGVSRKRIIAGNWKMHKTSAEAEAFIKELIPLISEVVDTVFLAVPFTAIEAAAKAALGSKIVIGAQNMHDAEEGAFTGEISATMLKAVCARFVLLGHSERRWLFGESDSFINRKVVRTLAEGLRPIVCVGETLAQRDSGQELHALSHQLSDSLANLTSEQLDKVVLAYEPVWAIGNGRAATPAIAQAAHRHIRTIVADKWGETSAAKVTILYGGSATPSNASSLMAEADIDGLLVGGAALKVESFSQIIHYHSLVSGS